MSDAAVPRQVLHPFEASAITRRHTAPVDYILSLAYIQNKEAVITA